MKQRARLAVAWMLFVAGCAALASAQDDRARALPAQIDRIFTANEYAPPRFGPARWLPDGSAYAIVERAGQATDIARYDVATGARTVLVAGTRLTPPGASTPLDIADYAWSNDGRRLLIFTNT